MTVSELSKRLSLSRPSVSERIARLQERGIITGFSAIVSAPAVGRSVQVIIQVSELKISPIAFERRIAEYDEILECHRVTGAVAFIIKAAVTDMHALNRLVERLLPCGMLNTSVILSSPVAGRAVLPLADKGDHQ